MAFSTRSTPPAPPPAYRLGAAFLWVGVITAVRLAALAVHPGDLHPDEAQYWSWSRALDWGYFSKPPLIAWAIFAATSVCGAGEACIKGFVPLLHMATAMAVYGIGHRLYDRRVGFFAALAYATLPGVSFSSFVASTDPLLLLFWALALYGVARIATATGGRTGWWVAIGVAVGLGLLAKYAMAFFVAALVLWAVLDREARARLAVAAGWRGPALAAALALIIYAPNLAWNATTGFLTYGHTRDNANLGGALFHPGELADFIAAQFGVFGPVLFATLLAVMTGFAVARRDWRARLLAAFVFAMLVPIAAIALLSRANANWAAPVYVAGTVWVTAALMAPGWRRAALGASLALHVVVALALALGLATHRGPGQFAGLGLRPSLDPFRYYDGWREMGQGITDLRARFPGLPLVADDRKILAELLYYVRPFPDDVFAWFGEGRPDDHFKLTRPYLAAPGADALFVARYRDAGRFLDRFREHQLVGTFPAPLGSGPERQVWVFHARGFMGYKPARP